MTPDQAGIRALLRRNSRPVLIAEHRLFLAQLSALKVDPVAVASNDWQRDLASYREAIECVEAATHPIAFSDVTASADRIRAYLAHLVDPDRVTELRMKVHRKNGAKTANHTPLVLAKMARLKEEGISAREAARRTFEKFGLGTSVGANRQLWYRRPK